MRARIFMVLIACFAALALVDQAEAAQPNIVFILTDDQRWDTLGYMPTVQSELVGRGVYFENAFVTNPLCCPSRASILTGNYSHTTRVYRNGGRLGGFSAFRDDSTLATSLDGAGYETALVGKYLNGYEGSYVPPGWDRWVSFTQPGYYRYGFDVDGETFPYIEREKYSTDFLADEAIAFIQGAPRPFFLYFAPYAPHSGAVPADRHTTAFTDLPRWRPPSFNEADVSDKPPWVADIRRFTQKKRDAIDSFRRRQLRSLLAVDESIAAIIRTLSESGELSNTVFVLMSDNGLSWGEHRLRVKRYPYEENIRVPFVVRYDSLVSSVRRDPHLVLGIDVAPTLGELAGATVSQADGQSIVPLLQESEDVSWRTRFLIEGMQSPPPTYCAVRTLRRILVTYKTGDRELYNLSVDPYELRNRADSPSQADTVGHLRRLLARLCNPPPPGLSRRLLCTHLGSIAPDVLVGSNRYDIMCGRAGHDEINPGAGPDYVYAGTGRDRVDARDGERDVISCGAGIDLARADAMDRVRRDCEHVIT